MDGRYFSTTTRINYIIIYRHSVLYLNIIVYHAYYKENKKHNCLTVKFQQNNIIFIDPWLFFYFFIFLYYKTIWNSITGMRLNTVTIPFLYGYLSFNCSYGWNVFERKLENSSRQHTAYFFFFFENSVTNTK